MVQDPQLKFQNSSGTDIAYVFVDGSDDLVLEDVDTGEQIVLGSGGITVGGVTSTGDIADDQGNILWDYSTQRAPQSVDIVPVSSNTTTDGPGLYLVDTSGGAVTLTLASTDASNQESIGVVNLSGSNAVTVDTEGSETIDPGGASSKTLSTGGWLVWFNGDGTNWDASLDADLASAAIDDLDIGSNDFVSTGDFAAIGPAWSSFQRTFSTTSTSYTSDAAHFNANTVWDTWAPADATTAILTEGVMGGSAGDVRLQNVTDSETIFEELDLSAGTGISRIDSYTPTTTASTVRLSLEVRTNDSGSSSDLNDFHVSAGVQL